MNYEATDTPQRGCRSICFIYTACYGREPIPSPKMVKHQFVIVNVFVIVEKPCFSLADTYDRKGETLND